MSSKKLVLIPLMLCFFAMGFVDLVGIASNYVKEDLQLTDSVANVFPSLVFFWFLIFSVPTGILMNKIGRKKTVLLSLIVTLVSLVLPVLGENFGIMLVSFSLLGIGNALMQTSLNPLISTVIKCGHLASTLTFGQFVKAIASFLAPYLAMWGAMGVLPTMGLGWRALFVIYLVMGIFATLLLAGTPIEEEPVGQASSVTGCLRLLGKPVVLLSFIGIMCHVGIDVGTNAVAPRILLERLGTDTDTVSKFEYATSIYFAFRTLGCFTGSIIMRKLNIRTFFTIIVLMMAVAMVGLVFGTEQRELWAAIALVGYGNSNVFSIVLSQAMLSAPEKKNEVSGLMIMGLFGGTVFPLFMGFASDAAKASGAQYPQVWAAVVMAIGVAYLLSYIPKVKQ